MSSAPDLQQKLFKQMGIDVPESASKNAHQNQKNGRKFSKPLSRKDERKAQREGKKANRYSRQPGNTASTHRDRQILPTRAASQARSQRSKPKTPVKTKEYPSSSESESEDGGEQGSDDEFDEFEDDEMEDDVGADNPLAKSVKDKLAQDDAEIEAFERKLGIKKGRKSLPQAFKDDGLGELLGELQTDGMNVGDEEEEDSGKRKQEFDDWLASKRQKVVARNHDIQEDDSDMSLDEMATDDEDSSSLGQSSGRRAGELNDVDDNMFEGFESSDDEPSTTTKQKENPYVAPTTGNVVAKYVPPSLRRAAGSEGEQRSRLHKSIQGLINRLTDANILSIVQSAEQLYQDNARGDVTEIMTDIILAQICKPETLPDQFFVLTGGFTAAVYKINGASFASHVIRRLVKGITESCEKAKQNQDGEAPFRKEAANLVAFLTQLYVFEATSCRIIFDFMERFLEDLSELNVELLLRICRMAGRLLRRDDPQSIKHIASVLNKGVSGGSYENVSVRTKFMVETINDLKNSKTKAKGIDAGVVSEHVQRMKKRIGELKSQTRRFEGLAPMGVSLSDIEGADTQGKWWLVGASVPVKSQNASSKASAMEHSKDAIYSDDEDMDFVLPDYPQKARSQGFSTMSQIAIFTALMSGMNYEHGYRQFLNLKLKKDDQLEIAKVLVQCVGSEVEYNEYYGLVAKQACSNGRIRFAFQDRLWRIMRGLGESMFGDEADDDDTADGERMKDEQRLSHTARFYATLVADGSLSIAVLKPLDLQQLNTWTSTFIEHLMIELLRLCKGKGDEENIRIEKIFGSATGLPALAAGIHWFLRKKARASKLITSKEVKKMDRRRRRAQTVVEAV